MITSHPKNVVNEASEIEFQVRSGNREEIPEVIKNDPYLVALSTTITMCWSQNLDERPTFRQIAQKLAEIRSLL